MRNVKGPFFRAAQLNGGCVPFVDAHMHTSLTDGSGTLEDYAVKAREAGMEAIAFTEHAYSGSPWLDSYVKSKERLQQLADPVQVYMAVETKCVDPGGAIDFGLDRVRNLDFIIGVLHRYPDGTGGYFDFDKLDPERAMDIDYNLSRALLSNPLVDVFGHPGGVYVKYFGAYDIDKMRDLIKLAASNGKIVEINTNQRYRKVLPVIVETCLELECMVSIGSDAHKVEELGHANKFLKEYLATKDN